jgi:hypothetical protein
MDFINEVLKEKQIKLIDELEVVRHRLREAEAVVTETSATIADMEKKIKILIQEREEILRRLK